MTFFFSRVSSGDFVTPAEIERELLTRLQRVVLDGVLCSDLDVEGQDLSDLALDLVLSMEEEFQQRNMERGDASFSPSHGSVS